jgi:nucleotide-binding universal stress UspA family protein
MLHLRKVLYPTDFSSCARSALDDAIFWAQEFDAELHMLHAVVLHQADPANPDKQFPGQSELTQSLYEVAGSQLAHLAGLPAETGIRIIQETQPGYSAAEVILDHAQEIDADLIVMGTHGRRALTRAFLGSVADRVVRNAQCPVVTIRREEAAEPLTAMRRLLVPVDFSEHSKPAVETGRELASRFGADLLLAHVVELYTLPSFYGPTVMETDLEAVRERAQEELDALLGESGGPAVPTETRVAYGRPSEKIIEMVDEENIGLIVIPSLGLTGLSHVLLGSTAERVVRRASCPVLTLKALGNSLLAPAES